MSDINRREFLRGALIIAALPALRRLEWRAPIDVRLGFDSFEKNSAAWNGLTLGIEEAQHAAQLFGGSIEIISPLEWSGLSAVIGAGDDKACWAASKESFRTGIPFLNSQCDDPHLRGGPCPSTMLNVAPLAGIDPNGDGVSFLAWDPSLEKYGADTLNGRFRGRFGKAMTSEAWTAWMSVKIIWESALRARSGEPSKILGVLHDPATKFDGHKGVPLTFRFPDRQLRQPIYRREAGRLVQYPADPTPEALDAFATAHDIITCQ